jgi:hypothetical protein
LNPLEYDLFDFWRWFLAVVCTVYAVVVTARGLWDWHVWLSPRRRETALLRQYVIVMLLKLRLRNFLGEIARIGFWAALLAALVCAHLFWLRRN